MTETVVMRGPTRLTSTSIDRQPIDAELRAEALERFNRDDLAARYEIALDRLWQSDRGMSRGFGRFDPPHSVSAPKQRSEPIGVEVDAGGEG